MRNRRLAALMIFTMLISVISSALLPAEAFASAGVTMSEGKGKGPDVEVVRVDEDGNEVIEDDEEKNGSKDTDSEEIPEDPSDMTYEDDLSGYLYPVDQLNMTTIYVSTADDLINLAKNCRLDTWSKDKNIVLKDDIVLDGSGFKYIPIFGGIFDGQGHTISGVTVSDAESYTGLFCITQESAVIKDLKVQGSFVPSGKQLATGGIVGDNYGMISNCSFEGNIDGYDYTGGIAGYNEHSGVISTCKSSGYVSGMHFTGGITGYNLGVINGCTNDAKINISSVDETLSIKDVNIDQYEDKLRNLFGDNNKQDSTNVLNSTVDTGGICGYSQGQILSCVNNALVGYEHFGYNVGGIVGRHNGYVDMCINNGEIYGRKDVGGIAGQAEPYVVIDITKDIIGQLTTNMNTLHDLVGTTLNDAGNESNIITARLNMVKSFTDKALGDTSYLANETEDFINGAMDTGSEALSRVEYAMRESVKENGVFDRTRSAFKNASNAASNLTKAVDDLDIYKYMSEAEKLSYNQAKENIRKADEDFDNFYNKRNEEDYSYNYYKTIGTLHNTSAYYGTSSNLIPLDADGHEIPWDSLSDNASYSRISRLAHKDTSTDPPTYTDFPSSDEKYAEKDKSLDTAASAEATAVVAAEADNDFRNKYGESYASYMEKNIDVIAKILEAHEQEMTENTRKDIKYAVSYTKQSMNDLDGAVGETKRIVSDLSSRSGIRFPKLSDEYKVRSNSLIANIQGMSDNLGFLNNEMNASNQQLVDDMGKVNDQFNVIMLLIADAIDGVLDADYTDVYTDNSLAVAETCTDATIADSINYGSIHGDIDTAGIAGTMAIEYDFDLESDVTGIKDAAKGTTYRTKCVLRRNKNDGYVEGLKSYVGGACGRQEMGTIIHCQNYGKLKSSSGSYIGGISGESLSTIHDCCTKGILNGSDHIGGIAGKGYDIRGCYSMPSIDSNGSCLGAIAGDNDPDGRIYQNYFVSDDYAGINRISYSGKAEPIAYKDLISMEGIPSEFNKVNVTFIVDDEVLTVKEYDYDSCINELPDEVSTDEYILWDWESSRFNDLRADAEVIGQTAKYITTLAGQQLRESGQSAVLVDGRFVEGQVLSAELSGVSSEPGIVETWKITVPEDSSSEHLIRYCPPSSVKDFCIWLTDGSGKKEAELTPMGKYYTFIATGYEVEFSVEDTYVNPFIKYAAYEGAGAAVLIALSVLIIHKKKKGRKTSKSGSDSSSEDTIDGIIDLDLEQADDKDVE